MKLKVRSDEVRSDEVRSPSRASIHICTVFLITVESRLLRSVILILLGLNSSGILDAIFCMCQRVKLVVVFFKLLRK